MTIIRDDAAVLKHVRDSVPFARPKQSLRSQLLGIAPVGIAAQVKEHEDRIAAFAGVDQATQIVLDGRPARIVPVREINGRVECVVMRKAEGGRWGYTQQRIIVEKHS